MSWSAFRMIRTTPSVILIFFALLLFGCASPPQRVVVIKPTETVKPPPTPVIDLDLINNKISYLNHLLQGKNLNEEERRVALDQLKAYENIKALSQLSTSHEDYKNIIHVLLDNLERLDKAYFSRQSSDKERYPKAPPLFSLERKKILDAYLSGDYQGVIHVCRELESEFGPGSIPPELGLLYSISLAEKGRLKEAAEMADKVDREMEGKPDLLALRANMVRWQLALGNKKKAIQTFDRLTGSMEEKNGLLRMAKNRITQEERPTEEAPVASQPPPQESDSISNLHNEVNGLIERRAFDEARLLLIKGRLRAQNDSDIQIIEQAMKTLEAAEGKYKMEEPIGSPSLPPPSHSKETIEVAKRLLEEESFEDALQKLEELKDDPEVAVETKALKDLTIEKLINHERNEAAKLFLLAVKANDPSKKREFLLQSHKILKDLIDKYPSSNLVDKLNDNLNKVRKEMDKLGITPG